MSNRDDSNEDANARKDDCLRSPRLIIVNFDIAVVCVLAI